MFMLVFCLVPVYTHCTVVKEHSSQTDTQVESTATSIVSFIHSK